MIKIGINRALWLFGVIQVISILGFVWLSLKGPFAEIRFNELIALTVVIGFEALGVGLGTSAFVAFIARTTNPLYTATQFALFTSFASIPRTIINSTTGFMIDILDMDGFFSGFVSYWLSQVCCFYSKWPLENHVNFQVHAYNKFR